ncbi:MAG: hypothetical protein WAM60_12295 [Candidatus Promineifilaceae bacterium]
MIDTSKMTPRQIQEAGTAVLLRELGPAGLLRFLQQFEMGTGDYTKEHHEWLDHLTVDEVIQLALREQENEQ